MDDKVSEKSESYKNTDDYFVLVCFAFKESHIFIKNTPRRTIIIDPICHIESDSLKSNPIVTATTGIK